MSWNIAEGYHIFFNDPCYITGPKPPLVCPAKTDPSEEADLDPPKIVHPMPEEDRANITQIVKAALIDIIGPVILSIAKLRRRTPQLAAVYSLKVDNPP